ncbi:hypothetical protein L1987_14320 [Smallanthus sonchifolius]|uniref:Uncharacterized protein n=1 Tax=Smallanthus sonchifolius TaxID=185202 RepID=A0ACB9J4L7_9ASTR|nr:hypothetical protein L1987_14320 [Smallanthus sonchifolius]
MFVLILQDFLVLCFKLIVFVGHHKLLIVLFSKKQRMDHIVVKATLGLTHPAQIDHPKPKRVSLIGPKRVSLIGLGKGPTGPLSASDYRVFGESVASAAKASQANNVAVTLASSEGLTPESKLAAASAIAKGTLLGTYEDNRFKSESKKPSLKSVDFFGLGGGPELEKKLKYTEDVCSGVILAKVLV